ncbi:MAG TPA: NAD(P)/FAD-dependent oxidoreductase [Segetibacter sp.]|nr:NAD(P)/FAD-dependent oxidoreductase [Segetibacter sp.]
MVYDIAIVGGGLAGLCLAIQCAEKQYSVILFEKEEYPFHKVCGEYISLESWDFLQRLGVQLDQFTLPGIKTLLVSDSNGKAYTFNLPLGGFGISRYSLDNTLYHIALAKGVEVCTNSKVNNVEYNEEQFVITYADKKVHTKVAAGTFGKRSNLDVKLKRPFVMQRPNALNNYIGIKYHIRYPHIPDYIYLHNFYNGYCGLSKIEDNKSCLCYLTTAENLRNCKNSIEELQRQVLYKNPKLKKIFTSAEFLFEQPLAISQISFNKKSQVENHVLMLGDAAGMISPLCGNGMSMAMHSAKLAFQQIQKFLSNDITRTQMEEAYLTSWKNKFSKRLWMGRNVQRFFGGNLSTSLFIKSMHYFTPVSKYVIQSTHGEPF